MAQHSISLPAAGVSPAQWYESVRQAPGFQTDPAQAEAIALLERLYRDLVSFKVYRARPFGKTEILGFNLRAQPALPRGLYMWGGVGRGKSLLMDVFFNGLPYQRKRRLHFHAFMQEIHRQLAELKSAEDPLATVAEHIAKDVRVLCFDEFHVSDIADAMILGRLLTHLFQRGVVMLATSNYPPEGLYPNGLQRNNFLPTIKLLKDTLDVLNLDGGKDHRQRLLTLAPLYLTPISEEHEAHLGRAFAEISQNGVLEPVFEIAGHKLKARWRAPGIVWFDFQVLCGDQRSQVDYLFIARECQTVLLSGIPVLGPEQAAEARRLTWLVDVFYDYRVKLMVTAAARPEALYPQGPMANEFVRTASRLTEMQTQEYLALEHEAASPAGGIAET